ncbi:Gametocyte-specific factor 1-like [Trichinella spiralis]|uniref:Gametocyte-specific factor 1-like n=1 Tax=Trichinella spiralis TaxID=6334 RepID=A0ABR3K941_TRISP
MERKLRTCLDQILPNKTKLAQRKVTPPCREFKEDDHVFARCYNELDKWSKAQIVDWADCSTWFVLKLAWY